MEIDLLYVADCPNRDAARHLVAQALSRADRVAVVREREVRSPKEAERLGMRGSPTILVDGNDPFADRAGAIGMACRLYPADTGLSDVETLHRLVRVLTR